MEPAPAKPIVSTRSEDPAVEERIDRFVVGLGERIDALQDAESAGDRNALGALARAFAEESRELGYPSLAEAAAQLAEGCVRESMEALRKGVVDLTELSQRVRRGHRSAAS